MNIDINITKDTIDYFVNVIMPQVAIAMLIASGILGILVYIWDRHNGGSN